MCVWLWERGGAFGYQALSDSSGGLSTADVPLISLGGRTTYVLSPTVLCCRYNEQYMESEGVTEGWQKDILRRARRGGG